MSAAGSFRSPAVGHAIPAYAPAPSLSRAVWALALLGAGAAAVGGLASPARLWAGLLVAGLFLAGLGLAAMAFVAIHQVSGAGWATVLRRAPEALYPLAPLGGLLVLLAIAAGGGALYPWMEPGPGSGHGAHGAGGFKAVWLRPGFFYLRAATYVLLWAVFAARLRRLSRAQDAAPSHAALRAANRTSVLFLFVFAVTLSAAAVDWVMSLEPHWFSTIFGVYHFSGLFLSGLAVVTLLALGLSRPAAPLEGLVGEAHRHDLGKLLFAFSTFWMYIWFSQFMLIWYSNLPEETVYYVPRLTGGWATLFVANAVVNWGIPFLVLLSQPAKRNPRVLARVALLLLFGRWLDLYVMIAPPVLQGEPAVGAAELGPLALAAALALWVVPRGLAAAPPVPLADPLLAESVHHHG